MQKKYKIAILGGYGLRNFGDDALMYILHKKLSSCYQEKEMAYICTPDKYLQKIISTSTVFDINSSYLLKTNLLLYGGGTQFYSFRPKKTLVNKIFINLKNPLQLIKKIILKVNKQKTRNKKMVIDETAALGIGVGPFLPNADKSIEMNTKNLFLNMSFVGVRDDYSMDRCKRWGLTNVKQYADLCYLMDNEFKIDNKNNCNTIKKIGIIVRDWTQTDEGAAYYDKIEPLMKELSLEGYEVNIIVFSEKRDLYWLKKTKNIPNTLIWNADDNTIEDFIVKLDAFDLFITARYHGAIFATLLGKPFISICVEQKLEMISDLYKNGSQKWQYPFDQQICTKYIHDINTHYNMYQDVVHTITDEQKKLAKQMFNDLFMRKVNI